MVQMAPTAATLPKSLVEDEVVKAAIRLEPVVRVKVKVISEFLMVVKETTAKTGKMVSKANAKLGLLTMVMVDPEATETPTTAKMELLQTPVFFRAEEEKAKAAVAETDKKTMNQARLK